MQPTSSPSPYFANTSASKPGSSLLHDDLQLPLIRRLTLIDAPAYRSFRLHGFREHPDAFTSSFEEESMRAVEHTEQRLSPASGVRLWGAFVGGELVGMIGLIPETRQKNRHKAALVGMFVAPEHAGKGLGSALVKALLRDAGSLSIELIVLTVTDTNKPAIGLYQKAGFVCFGTEPDAIRVDGVSFGKTHMYLALNKAGTPAGWTGSESI